MYLFTTFGVADRDRGDNSNNVQLGDAYTWNRRADGLIKAIVLVYLLMEGFNKTARKRFASERG